jgi:hypothetical protein
MRKEGLARETIEAIALMADERRVDARGNPVAIGRDMRGQLIEVVIALDDLGYVITVIVRRKQR